METFKKSGQIHSYIVTYRSHLVNQTKEKLKTVLTGCFEQVNRTIHGCAEPEFVTGPAWTALLWLGIPMDGGQT